MPLFGLGQTWTTIASGLPARRRTPSATLIIHCWKALCRFWTTFELGLEAAKNTPDATGIVQGLQMVRKQLEDFLRDHGVEIVNAEGNPFDPNLA